MTDVSIPQGAHQNVIAAVAFSPDGRTLLSGSWDGTAKLWDVATGHILHTFAGAWDAVKAVTFTPDGRSLLIAGEYPEPAWTAADLQQIQTVFAAPGRTAASYPESPEGDCWPPLRCYDAASGTLRWAADEAANDLAVTLDGATVAATDGGTVRAWDAASGQPRWNWELPEWQSLRRVWSSNGTRLAVLGWEPGGWILEGSTGRVVQELAPPWFHDRGFSLATDVPDLLGYWQTTLAEFQPHHNPAEPFLAFSPSGKIAALVGSERTPDRWALVLQLWALDGPTLVHTVPVPGGRTVRALAFSPAGDLVATVGDDRHVHLWDVTTGQLLRSLGDPPPSVSRVAFSHGGSRVALGDPVGRVRIWRPGAPSLPDLIVTTGAGVQSLAFGDCTLAIGYRNGTVALCPITGAPSRTWQAHAAHFVGVAFLADGSLVTVGHEASFHGRSGRNAEVKRWSPPTGELVQTVAVPGPGIHTLTLARGGRRLAVASKVAVYLWEDLADPVLWPVYKIRARDSAAHLIALAPDGITLVVAREGHQVQLVDLVSGQVTREFYSIRDWPCALALAPDGGTLALATGFANFIQLFHLPEGRLFRCLHGHRNVICDLAFSADGGRHASGSADGTARVWDTVTWQPVALLEPEDDSYPMAPASG